MNMSDEEHESPCSRKTTEIIWIHLQCLKRSRLRVCVLNASLMLCYRMSRCESEYRDMVVSLNEEARTLSEKRSENIDHNHRERFSFCS